MALPPRRHIPGLAAGGIARRLSEQARASAGGRAPGAGSAPAESATAAARSITGGFADGVRAACENFAAMLETLGAAGAETIAKELDLPLGPDGKARAVFGYTLRMGLDGAHAEPFGDVASAGSPRAPAGPTGGPRQAAAASRPWSGTGRKPAPAKAASAAASDRGAAQQAAPPRAPITDLFEEGGFLRVVAELPGATEAGLRCAAEQHLLRIETDAPAYAKTLALPRPVRPESLQHTLANGILEVRLVLADTDPGGTAP